jgi:glycosyltransferase involved in cell wall biosynthesis
MAIDAMNKDFKISIFCLVYNHEPYLKDCIEGFLMQRCNFNFEIVVGEDCSSDRSREILLDYHKKFPGKFKLLLHDQNVGAIQNQNLTLNACDGKYIALCEGDDYWTDPYKLQKQVDFLEANEDYSVCAAKSYCLDKNGQINDQSERYKEIQFPKTITLDNLFTPYLFQTNTILFRNNIIPLSKFDKRGFKDIVLFAALLKLGKGIILDCYLGCYRIHLGGIWSCKSPLEKSYENMLSARILFFKFKKENRNIFMWITNTYRETMILLLKEKGNKNRIIKMLPLYFYITYRNASFSRKVDLKKIIYYLLK